MTFYIRTEVAGNPDRGQDPHSPPHGVTVRTISASTLEDLARKVSDWQGENNIGGGNWLNPTIYQDEEPIGFMSFNGRIWKERT